MVFTALQEGLHPPLLALNTPKAATNTTIHGEVLSISNKNKCRPNPCLFHWAAFVIVAVRQDFIKTTIKRVQTVCTITNCIRNPLYNVLVTIAVVGTVSAISFDGGSDNRWHTESVPVLMTN